MPKTKKVSYRPPRLTDDELWGMVHQAVLRASLHNPDVSVEELNVATDNLVKVIRDFSDKKDNV